MFSVFNRDQTSPAYLYDIASYWQKYAGNTSSVNLSFYRWNKEDIKKIAQSKKDAGMLSYLRNLNAYLDACKIAIVSGEYSDACHISLLGIDIECLLMFPCFPQSPGINVAHRLSPW